MDYKTISSDRQFKSATGYSKLDFATLLKDFESHYKSIYGKSYEAYLEKSVTEEAKLKDLGSALFFVLFYMKSGVSWDILGLIFGMSGSSAQENFERFSELLEQTLSKKGSCPNVNLRVWRNLSSMLNKQKN